MSTIGAYGGGNWGGLPELGITETLFGGKTGSLWDAGMKATQSNYEQASNNTSSPYYNYVKPTTSPTAPTTYYKPVSSTSTSISGTGDPLGSVIDTARQRELDRAAQEAAARKRMLRQARSAYNPFFEDLSRQEAEIPTIESDYMNTMNRGYQSQADVINRGQQAGLEQANQSTGVIKQNQATSLRDLASNLSNAVNAFGQRLGQAGAGDSSAANMANFAYSKLANRNTADVMAQVRGQLAEVETAKQNIVRDAQDKLSALETWKAEQTLSIHQYVRSLQDYISQARASGKTAMAQNEVDAIREGFTRSMERLQQINDFEITSKAEILANSQAALADANTFSQQLSSMGNIKPEEITQAPIDSGSISGGGTSTLPIPGTLTEEKDKSLSDLLYPTGSYDPNLGY